MVTWDAKALKATPLAADEILLIDTADSRNQKRATITSLPKDGIESINGDTTPAQIIASGTGLGIVDAGATHTLSIDGTVVTLTGSQTLTNKTLTTPTIASFTNATHDHSNAAGGGTLVSTVALSDVEAKTGTGTELVFSSGPTLSLSILLLPTITSFSNSTHDHSNTAGGDQLTNTALTSGVFAAITGIGTQSQALNMNSNNITGVGSLGFNADTAHTITDTATQLLINTNTGDDILFREVTTELFKINEVSGFVASRRIQGLKGADVASGSTITLVDGNFFDVTGTTQIDAMISTNWQAGSVVSLHFDAGVTVGHNIGGDGFFLAGAVNFVATADDTLTVVWNGNRWEELSRSIN